MSFPKRTTAIAAAAALMASVGVAEATHKGRKATAPGQVCKPLHQAHKQVLRNARAAHMPLAERKLLAAELREARRECIQAAVKLRQSDQRPAPTPTPGT